MSSSVARPIGPRRVSRVARPISWSPSRIRNAASATSYAARCERSFASVTSRNASWPAAGALSRRRRHRLRRGELRGGPLLLPGRPATEPPPGERALGAAGATGRLLRRRMGEPGLPGGRTRGGRSGRGVQGLGGGGRRPPAGIPRRTIDPDSFTHGSSEQRRTWFNRGYESGEASACDAYSPDEV
jgi:hypothetical protein